MNIPASEVYIKAAMRWGKKAQALKMVEETSELNRVLCKYINGLEYSEAELIDEMADVMIMHEQLMMNFGTELQNFQERVVQRVEIKLVKLNQILDAKEDE